jgi:hypothetical protein
VAAYREQQSSTPIGWITPTSSMHHYKQVSNRKSDFVFINVTSFGGEKYHPNSFEIYRELYGCGTWW